MPTSDHTSAERRAAAIIVANRAIERLAEEDIYAACAFVAEWYSTLHARLPKLIEEVPHHHV